MGNKQYLNNKKGVKDTMANGDNTFIQISNKEIFEEIKSMRRSFDMLNDTLIKTNEKIAQNQQRLNAQQKMIIGAYGFGMSILGFLVAHIMQ